jgi:N-acetylneuraminic acid mutarotase
MHPITARRITSTIFAVAIAALALPCYAHFLWVNEVNVDDKPQGLLYFGESPADETYHFPDKLAKTKLWSRSADGQRTEIETKSIETDDRVGRMGPIGDAQGVALETSQQYGIYGTALLVYHAKHINGSSADAINAAGTSKELKLEIVPHVKEKEVELTVLWDGKPLKEADVTVFVDEADPTEKKTNNDGHVTFTSEKGGLVGALANTLEKGKSGELDKKPYKGVMHYASLTFNLPSKRRARANDKGSTEHKNSKSASGGKAQSHHSSAAVLPPLPEPVASFGAVVSDGWLYVYGGHTGEEHEHSAANLSAHFRRIQLDGGKKWQELPMQTHLQGLPLVAHGGKIYRVGGLNNRNPTKDDKEDLHSTDEFCEYDPATNNWTTLAPLPAARSSHNAAVIGDKLYVVGGWTLNGKSPGTWQPDALVYDFNHPQSGWQKLPRPEFKRRALAAGVWQGKLFALGGMDEKGKPSLRVDSFDPTSGKWSQAPRLPGAGMAGFGASAWNLGGDLYVSGLHGILYRLSRGGSSWEEVAKLQTPRFFHQLVPGPRGSLLAVAGASMDGHLATIEQIDLKSDQAASKNPGKSPLK